MHGYIEPLVIAALMAYCAAAFRRKSDLLLLAAAAAVGVGLAVLTGSDAGLMLIGVLAFGGVAGSLGSRLNYLVLAAAAAFVAFAFLNGVPVSLVAQAALLGFIGSARSFVGMKSDGSKRMEKRRDLVQIAIGLAILGAFAALDYADAELFLLGGVLLGVLLSDLAVLNPGGGVSKAILSLERNDAPFGQGAMWLALGALVAVSFLGQRDAGAVLGSIFIGDAVATIVGIEYGRTKLPYNSKKSVAGSVAYFAAALAVSFPFIGVWALPTSFIAAAVESLPRQIDDNFDTSVALTVAVLLLASLAGMG
jgi:dolichol kinase